MTALAPPRGAVHRVPWSDKRGIVASWQTHPEPLEPGWLSTTLAEPTQTKTTELPRRVELLAGHQWTASSQLRAAARLLDAAADWLDTPDLDVGDQLSLLEGCERIPHKAGGVG